MPQHDTGALGALEIVAHKDRYVLLDGTLKRTLKTKQLSIMCQGFNYGLVLRDIICSGMSVYMAPAKNIHHVSYGLQRIPSGPSIQKGRKLYAFAEMQSPNLKSDSGLLEGQS